MNVLANFILGAVIRYIYDWHLAVVVPGISDNG